MTRLLGADELEAASQALLTGKIVVFPTDTVYGVGALATDEAAVRALFAAKGREFRVPLPVMVAQPEHIIPIATPTPEFWRLAEHFWPGPLTLILARTSALPDLVTSGGDTVGLRIPDHALALELLRQVDRPLAVTSANLSGQPPALTAQEAWDQLAGRVEWIVDGGPAPGGRPSTVLDLTSSPPHVLRPGPISAEMIAAIVGRITFGTEERTSDGKMMSG